MLWPLHSARRVRESATELVCAAPSQQHYNLTLNWSSSSHPSLPPRGAAGGAGRSAQHLEEGRGGTSRGDASCAQHQLRRKSISSVAAAEAGDGSVPRP